MSDRGALRRAPTEQAFREAWQHLLAGTPFGESEADSVLAARCRKESSTPTTGQGLHSCPGALHSFGRCAAAAGDFDLSPACPEFPRGVTKWRRPTSRLRTSASPWHRVCSNARHGPFARGLVCRRSVGVGMFSASRSGLWTRRRCRQYSGPDPPDTRPPQGASHCT